MPILGVIASSYAKTKPPSFESIATATGTGSNNSITFNSFGSGFTHLQIRGSFIGQATGAQVNVTFNGTTAASNYSRHTQRSQNGTLSATSNTSSDTVLTLFPIGLDTAAPSSAIIDIYDAFNTNKAKSVIAMTNYNASATGSFELHSGSWYASNAAISSITITCTSSFFRVGTTVALYGIKVTA